MFFKIIESCETNFYGAKHAHNHAGWSTHTHARMHACAHKLTMQRLKVESESAKSSKKLNGIMTKVSSRIN